MKVFIPDPDEEDEEPERTEEAKPRACVICGKHSPDGPECADCDEREFRRWGS